MASPYMITTNDNPYSPFKQFDDWNSFDMQKGYHTCSYLARITKTSNELSQFDEDLAVELAINEILDFDLFGIYRKVTEDSYNSEAS